MLITQCVLWLQVVLAWALAVVALAVVATSGALGLQEHLGAGGSSAAGVSSVCSLLQQSASAGTGPSQQKLHTAVSSLI